MPNTFAIPSAAKSFTLSQIDYNNSIQSVWSNFYGSAIPNSGDVTILGAVSAPLTGSLYRSSTYNTFYVYDPSRAKGGSIGGGYTRQGIGSRNFENITTLASSLATIEQAELLTTVGDSSANYRVYMKTSNSNSFVDIGMPPTGSLVTSMFTNRQISNVHIQAAIISQYELGTSSVVEAKIASSAVSTAKIADSAVTEGKIASSAVATAKIATSAVTAAKIADYTITGTKLADNLTYSSNLTVSGNVTLGSGKSLVFGDGTSMSTASSSTITSAGGGTSLIYSTGGGGTQLRSIVGESYYDVGLPSGTSAFDVISDGSGLITLRVRLGSG